MEGYLTSSHGLITKTFKIATKTQNVNLYFTNGAKMIDYQRTNDFRSVHSLFIQTAEERLYHNAFWNQTQPIKVVCCMLQPKGYYM